MTSSARRVVALLALVGLAALAAGCGEKSEPDLSNVPAPPEPQAPTPPQGLPQAVVGHWHGTLHQKGEKDFPIDVAIVSATDPDRNVVHYGGQIDCSGTWSYRGADGPLVRFREVIDRRVRKDIAAHPRDLLEKPVKYGAVATADIPQAFLLAGVFFARRIIP